MSRSNRTEPNHPHQRRRRRELPDGWSIIEGMGQPALSLCVDPVIEQTRELTYALFAASLLGRNVGFRRYPADAAKAWTDHAMRRGDVGLARILDQLDAETFSETWAQLVRRFDRTGAQETVEWLQRHIAGGAGA